MDVREKLVELLKEISYDQKLCWYDLWDMREGAEDIADLLIAHGVTVQEWISVNDRMPEEYTYVIVCDVRNDYVAEWEYRRDGIWDHEGCSYDNSDLTHWMPLPQPPKGE